MLAKPKTPWFYLTWRPPSLTPDQEVAMARMTRRVGLWAMLLHHWGYVTLEDGSMDLFCITYLLGQNYSPLLCWFGAWLGLEDCMILLYLWLFTFAWSTVRYIGWLIWLLMRWPPLAKG